MCVGADLAVSARRARLRGWTCGGVASALEHTIEASAEHSRRFDTLLQQNWATAYGRKRAVMQESGLNMQRRLLNIFSMRSASCSAI